MDSPYTRWILDNALPESMCIGILTLLIKPPDMGDSGGVRDLRDNNHKRTFLTPKLQADFPAVKAPVGLGVHRFRKGGRIGFTESQ